MPIKEKAARCCHLIPVMKEQTNTFLQKCTWVYLKPVSTKGNSEMPFVQSMVKRFS